MHLHNTLTGRKDAFTPLDPDRVTLYVCGPTVYSYAHIGNARPAVVFDVLARVLRARYPRVDYVRNITDIDDKINAAAAKEGVDIRVITDRYAAAYHEDLAALGVARPDFEPRVTEHLPQILDMIGRLIDSGHAYAAEGHVLFHTRGFADYGQLSKRDEQSLMAGARVEVAPYKRHAGDFVLWKPSSDDQPGWDSPWGRGRPGWHIECSAMAEALLGETIDIHGGGHDLIFPHHENEIAQSVCAHGGKTFARYWVHNGFLNVNSEKMSKSIGNVLLVRKLLEQALPELAGASLHTLDDYRKQVTTNVDMDILGACAERYGVSLTAAILKWLQYTDEKAVLVMSNDGFINWAWSSEPAARAGAFFRTRGNVIPLPEHSLAANQEVLHDRQGTKISAAVWFPHADPSIPLREMKIHAAQYDATLSLLCLPRSAEAWPPRDRDEE